MAPIDGLPNELRLEMAKHVDTKGLYGLALSCRSFRDIAQESLFYAPVVGSLCLPQQDFESASFNAHIKILRCVQLLFQHPEQAKKTHTLRLNVPDLEVFHPAHSFPSDIGLGAVEIQSLLTHADAFFNTLPYPTTAWSISLSRGNTSGWVGLLIALLPNLESLHVNALKGDFDDMVSTCACRNRSDVVDGSVAANLAVLQGWNNIKYLSLSVRRLLSDGPRHALPAVRHVNFAGVPPQVWGMSMNGPFYTSNTVEEWDIKCSADIFESPINPISHPDIPTNVRMILRGYPKVKVLRLCITNTARDLVWQYVVPGNGSESHFSFDYHTRQALGPGSSPSYLELVSTLEPVRDPLEHLSITFDPNGDLRYPRYISGIEPCGFEIFTNLKTLEIPGGALPVLDGSKLPATLEELRVVDWDGVRTFCSPFPHDAM